MFGGRNQLSAWATMLTVSGGDGASLTSSKDWEATQLRLNHIVVESGRSGFASLMQR